MSYHNILQGICFVYFSTKRKQEEEEAKKQKENMESASPPTPDA